MQKGEKADSNGCSKEETEPQPIPCCGCGGWSLVRVIGEPTVEEKDPATVLEPDDTLSFGKYKGRKRKVIDVYLENYRDLQWAEANIKNFLVNWQALMRVHREMRSQSANTNNQTESSE